MTNSVQEYDINAIRELLRDAFTPKELHRLFIYAENQDLRLLADELIPDIGADEMIARTITYCQKRVLLYDLLTEAKRRNPRQYARSYPELGKSAPSPPPGPGIPSPKPTPTDPGHRLPNEPETVSVPTGPFLMGSDWARDRYERPQHQVTQPTFKIGRYPVTNAEYSAFVDATGYRPPDIWYHGRFPQEQAAHPVTSVSWYDAQAYVAWLREWTGQPYRLPTEAEWEKAARGNDGRLWPWGDIWDPVRANCKAAGPGETTLVGQYSPQGDSPHGCADMAGNVLEWTQTLWGIDWEYPDFSYPYTAEDGRENVEASKKVFRLMRGGSFASHMPFVRCTCRYWGLPDNRDWYLGFRVCIASRQD